MVRRLEDEGGGFQLQARGPLRIRLRLGGIEQAEAEIVLGKLIAVAARREPAKDRDGFVAMSGQPQILGVALGIGGQLGLGR